MKNKRCLSPEWWFVTSHATPDCSSACQAQSGSPLSTLGSHGRASGDGSSVRRRRYDLLHLNELPTSFGEDEDGELYVTTEVGNVYKIVAT